MSQIIYQADSFTSVAFKGNPAGVCILKDAADVDWMKNIAGEMNLAETAFLYPTEDGYHLRWFTPNGSEVEMCGHATLASAHILYETGILDSDQEAHFHTLSGLLKAKKTETGIELDFPATPVSECTPPDGLLEALGVEALFVGKNQSDYLIEVASEAYLGNIKPDFNKLKDYSMRGFIVTAKGESQYDFVSRFFAPAFGIDEDPVTGSAHCTLGPYWGEKLGKTELKAYQASQRGGEVAISIDGDRIRLNGQVVTIFKIELV